MTSFPVFLRIFVLVAVCSNMARCVDLSTAVFSHSKDLDDNYNLQWNFNTTHIVFRMQVRTLGYIGFGISEDGRMFPSDVIIGWVANGVPHLADRHATGHFPPPVDAQQDWTLLEGSESGGFTTLVVGRLLVTCDPNGDDDRPITPGSLHLIYSYHDNDPPSDAGVAYHGRQRGTKPVVLLRSPPPPPQAGDDVAPMTFDFINRHLVTRSTSPTTFSCSGHRLPDLNQKHHITGVAPVIPQGHQHLVRHIALFLCTAPPTLMDGEQFPCDVTVRPGVDTYCAHPFLAWSRGDAPFAFPQTAGFPHGGQGTETHFVMRIHYDTTSLSDDVLDTSGLRISMTSQLRQHDAGLLEAGVTRHRNHVVPPHYANFVSQGVCHQGCLSEGLEKDQLHVFAGLVHAHRLARNIKTRLVRGGTELPPFFTQTHFRFSADQELISLPEQRVIQGDDNIIVECTYDSQAETTLTLGGMAVANELCLASFFYYPKVPLLSCTSLPTNVLADSLFTVDWTNEDTRTNFQQSVNQSAILHSCSDGGSQFYNFHGAVTDKVDVTLPYVPHVTCP